MTVTDYLQKSTPQQQAMYASIKQLVLQAAPDSTEDISYGMPCFKRNDKAFLHFGAFKNHMSLFPGSDAMIEEVGESLAKFRTSTGTLQFTSEEPIPANLLKGIIAFRLNELDQGQNRA